MNSIAGAFENCKEILGSIALIIDSKNFCCSNSIVFLRLFVVEKFGVFLPQIDELPNHL